jgi:cytochrome c peroxidase
LKRTLATAAALLTLGLAACLPPTPSQWSVAERETLRALWLGSLPPLPPDPSNRVADDARAAEFGRRLFFDTRLSASGYVSCATCHRPDRGFQENLPLAKGMREANRRTPSLLGAAYRPWLYWDGRRDSLWAQALTALEGANEHGGHRYAYARLVVDFYRADYEAIFGPLPRLDWTRSWNDLTSAEQDAVTHVFVNIGKAIAAYERTLLPQTTRFDAYVEAVLDADAVGQSVLSADEVAGLRLFIGRAGCVSCHATPLFSDGAFHNTGIPARPGHPPDSGWAGGQSSLASGEFGCASPWSDATPEACAARPAPVVGATGGLGAFKTPSLRGVAGRAPYMHAGQFATLAEVLNHYRAAPTATVGQNVLQPLPLTDVELRQLEAFLATLEPQGRSVQRPTR